MKRYYSEEQLADLRKRWSPEVQAESERGWAALARDTEAAMARGEDPCGKTGQELASRRRELLRQFTGGDPEMETSLQKLYADKTNWPQSFKKPFRRRLTNSSAAPPKESLRPHLSWKEPEGFAAGGGFARPPM